MPEPRAESAAVDEARRRVEALTRIVARPIGSPTALGPYDLAAATLVVAGQQLGWIDSSEQKQVGAILIGFPILAQLVASVWSRLARDGVAAAAMGVLAFTWLSVGLVPVHDGASSHAPRRLPLDAFRLGTTGAVP
jgi:succinate-acetate transporter protein